MIFLLRKAFFAEINLYKKIWIIKCFCNPHKSDIGKHLDIVSKSLDTYSTKHENIVVLGDFNACVEGETLDKFCKCYSFNSLIKQPIFFKNPKSPSCIAAFVSNHKCVVETGLSDFHRMTIPVLKMHFRKLSPKIINYRDFKKFDNERFTHSLQYALSEEHVDYSKNPEPFFYYDQRISV